MLFCSLILKVHKSVYIAKSRKRNHKTLNKILLHGTNHALKDMCMLIYETIGVNSFYYCSIEVLIDLINLVIAIHNFFKKATVVYFSIEYLWQKEFLVSKLPSSCLVNTLSASGCLLISVTWLINFQMVFVFYMSLSSVCLFSIQ